MERVHFHREKSGLLTLRLNHKFFKGGRFSYSIGETVTDKNWENGSFKRDQPTQMVTTFKSLRYYIEGLRAACQKHMEGSINSDKLRKELDAIRKIAPKKQDSFFETWEEITKTTKTAKAKPITAGTIRDKNQSMKMLMEFAPDTVFQDITMEFYHRYFQWLFEKCPRTMSKHIKNLKALMAEAHDRGIIVPMDYTKKSFRTPRIETESTFLNEQEINKLLNTDLAPRLIPIRDMFVLACYCGQRIGDWHQLSPSNVENGLIKVMQHKGKKLVHIPIHPIVKSIWSKYQNGLPELPSDQKLNVAIKDICQVAELGDIFIEGELQPKYQFISSHSARRSFASNAFLSGMDTLTIRTLTGHKSESSFLKYIRLDSLQHGQQAASHSFFLNSELKLAS
jgi:site-specific recombinase XerD